MNTELVRTLDGQSGLGVKVWLSLGQLVLRDNTLTLGLGSGFVVTLQFSVLLQLRL